MIAANLRSTVRSVTRILHSSEAPRLQVCEQWKEATNGVLAIRRSDIEAHGPVDFLRLRFHITPHLFCKRAAAVVLDRRSLNCSKQDRGLPSSLRRVTRR